MPASKPTDYINYRQFNVTPVLRLANGKLSSRMPHIVDRCISTNSQRTSPSESSGISINTFEGTVHRFDTGGRGTVSSLRIRLTSSVYNFFDPSGRYGRFYGVTAKSKMVHQW